MNAANDVIKWLLESGGPGLQYRVRKELLGCSDDDPELCRLKAAIPEDDAVRSLQSRMHPDGYWLQRNPRSGERLGDGVIYGSFATTHFVLAYLSELCADRSMGWVSMAAERYLSLQKPSGEWLGNYSCLTGYNIRTFVRLGYRDDSRVRKALQLMLETPREDGGYLCDMHEGKYKTRSVKSCFRGSLKTLLAFAEFPEIWGEPRCIELVEYFLRRGGIYKSNQPEVWVNKDMARLSFPIIWRANTWEVLYALSKMGYGGDPRLEPAWAALEKCADPQGRWPLDWTPTECAWKVGKMGEPNPWITLYVLAAKMLRDVKGEV